MQLAMTELLDAQILGIADMRAGQRHEKEETEHVLPTLAESVRPVEIDEPLELVFVKEHDLGLHLPDSYLVESGLLDKTFALRRLDKHFERLQVLHD